MGRELVRGEIVWYARNVGNGLTVIKHSSTILKGIIIFIPGGTCAGKTPLPAASLITM